MIYHFRYCIIYLVNYYYIKYYIFQLFCYYHSSSAHSQFIDFCFNFPVLHFIIKFIIFFSQYFEYV